jgi:hypothetical protein
MVTGLHSTDKAFSHKKGIEWFILPGTEKHFRPKFTTPALQRSKYLF